MTTGFSTRSLIGGAFALAVIGLITPIASAQGQGGGSATGTIYFINGASPEIPTNYMHKMGADGSNPVQLDAWGRLTYPSDFEHNGYRWFVTVLLLPPGLYYPDGVTRRREVFAFREDYHPTLNNNSETRVQLTDDPTLEPTGGGFKGMCWINDDLTISFKARRWFGVTIAEGGLYTADIAYRTDGNIVGIATPPVAPTLAFPLDANGWPTFGSHTWDPSAGRVAYTHPSADGLWVANLATNTRTQIRTTSVSYPDWSGDGSKIVFSSGSSIITVKPDGKGPKTVLSPYFQWSGFTHPSFSPGGSYIVCGGIPSGTNNYEVIRISSGGGSIVNLTNTPSLAELPIDWL